MIYSKFCLPCTKKKKRLLRFEDSLTMSHYLFPSWLDLMMMVSIEGWEKLESSQDTSKTAADSPNLVAVGPYTYAPITLPA